MTPAPLTTLRRPAPDDVVPIEAAKLGQVLEEVLADVRDGRRDIAITNLTHAVQVAYGEQQVPRAIRRRLDAIIRIGGGCR